MEPGLPERAQSPANTLKEVNSERPCTVSLYLGFLQGK